MSNSVRVYSPASIGNIGPGYDVLGLAVTGLGDKVIAREISGDKIIIEDIQNADHDISKNPAKNTMGIAAEAVREKLGIKSGVNLKLIKGLPSGSGIGSSAASAAAGAFAVNALFDGGLSSENLIHAAMEGEAFVSGGYFADNVAPSLLGGATLTQSINPLKIAALGDIDALHIILVTPKIQILTKDSRAVLPESIPMKAFIRNLANTASITAAFTNNDYTLLKDNLQDDAIEPHRSKLIPGFYNAKEAAINAGADGLCISGAGPTVFAITNKEEQRDKIASAIVGAFHQEDIEAVATLSRVDKQGTRQI